MLWQAVDSVVSPPLLLVQSLLVGGVRGPCHSGFPYRQVALKLPVVCEGFSEPLPSSDGPALLLRFCSAFVYSSSMTTWGRCDVKQLPGVVFDQHPRENTVLSEWALRHSDAVQTSLSGGHTSLLTGFGPLGLLSTVELWDGVVCWEWAGQNTLARVSCVSWIDTPGIVANLWAFSRVLNKLLFDSFC